MKFKELMSSFKKSCIKNSPEIMLGFGLAGMLISVVITAKTAVKVHERTKDISDKKEKFKASWKSYVPAATTFTLSAACIIGSNRVSAKRNASLAAAYALTETAFSEYKAKVIETIGEKKEQAINDSIAKDKIEGNPPSKSDIIITGKGETLCYDEVSGRYFKYDIEKLRRIENKLNQRLLTEMYLSLNDLYAEIGLPDILAGEELGWNIENGLIQFVFSSQLAEDDTPCLVLSYDHTSAPKRGYKELY